MNTLALVSVLTLAVSAPFALAQADTPAAGANTASLHVTYDRLALGRPATDAALQADLRRAARQVCNTFGRPTLADRAQFDACYAQAMDGAHRQLDAAHGYASTVAGKPTGG